MASADESFDVGPPSPSPDPRSGLAFKPPTRPGASLRGRKSTAALAELNTNRPPTSMSIASSDPTDTTGSTAKPNSAIDSRPHSPASSYESPTPYDAASSSNEAQALAATQAARQRLQQLSEENESQTTAAGLLGQGLLDQRRKLEELREQLHEELSALERDTAPDGDAGAVAGASAASASGERLDAARYQRVRALAERIDAETEEMALERKALLVKALGAGSDNLLVDGSSLASGMGSPSKSPLSTYAFLASDPAARVTPTKGRNPDSSSASGGGGPTPRQSDRRARNAAAPSSIGDQNLVNQLQDGLVNEIRRLHSLLLQREHQIKLADEARKKSDEELATWKPKALSLMEQEDAIKQENWDLQIARQQLEEQLEEERIANKKLESERNRVTKELAKIRETADERKVQIDGQAAELDRVRTLRETETALARREKASLQREYSDLQSEAQKYKAEIQKLERANLSRSVSNSMLSFNGPGAADESDDGMVLTEAARRKLAEASAPGSPGGYSEDLSSAQSPLGTRLVRDREISDLRGKLAMAQKKTGKDSAEKRRLRDQNQELRRLLAKAGLDAPISSDVESSDAEDDAESWVDEAGSVGGRGKSRSRLPKSSTRPNIASRLGLGPSVGSHGASDQDDDVEDSFEDASQSAPDDDSASERASLEGMDPAFADIGRPDFIKKGSRRSTIKPSNNSSNNNNKHISTSSPLTRQVTLPDERGDTTTEELHDDESSLGDAARMPSNRRGGQRFRPASDVVPAAALGNELAGLDQSHSELNLSVVKEPEASGGDSSVVIHNDRETEEHAVQTQPMADLVGPALAAQQARHEQVIEELQASHQSRHESAISELQTRHNDHVESITRSHDEAVALLRDQHKARLDELAHTHDAALQTRDAKSAEVLSEAAKSHESALSAKEAAAAAALAAALATQSKTHEAAMTEARSRHTQALANQVAAHTEALSAAEGKHRSALAERERLHKAELEKREHRHHQALEQKDRDHQAMVEDIQATNDTFLSQRDAAYSAALKDRDEQVVKTRAEVQRLRTEIEDLSAQLKEAKEQLARALAEKEQRTQELDEARAAHAAALAAATAEVVEARKEQGETQEVLNQQQRAAEAEAEAEAEAKSAAEEAAQPLPPQAEPDVNDSARQSSDINDVFQDAVDSQDEQQAPASVPAPTAAAPAVPVEEPGIRRVVLAELKDSGCQTDDEVWARIRQEQLSLRPTSVALARPGETTVGPGGLTVLGGYPARTRDSVGTFGGLREASGGYDRPESPAPTNYSVSALGTSRRPSIDSMISSRRQHDMPPPAIPDKTKPPVMAVPPPPSMPPPSHIPRRSGASVSTEDGIAPPRPTSPPPSKFLARASQRNGSTLQVPGKDGGELPPRSVSRASSHFQGGAPPTSYVAPGSAPTRQRMPRRSSNVSRADQESIASTSMASRISGGRLTPNHLRHASGTSVASDVTSELSRRHSVSSSQASDAYNEHPGDKTVTIADSRNAARRGPRASNAGMIEATDPAIIQSITKTMIGEYLYKYTRRTMRSGHSDKRHQRYFWVHPYTKMLYWTITDPGGARVPEGTSKSACIEDVRVVDDPSSNPPGLFHLSILIKTTARELKVTAANKESHETWLNALGYLVNRGNSVTAAADTTIVANATATPASGTLRSRNSTASRAARMLSPARSLASVGRRKSSESAAMWNDATPRARNASHSGASILDGASTYRSKRRDTAAREFLQQTALRRTGTSEYGSGAGDHTHSTDEAASRSTVDPRLQTAEEMLEENEREGFEGLDNVRACCGGAHDVGALAHKQYLQKQRRGSAVGAGSSRQSTGGGRPSSRLSNASSTRPRGASNASGSTDSHHQRNTSAGTGTGTGSGTAAPPQLGPLNLNAPRGFAHHAPAQKGESFASMFDLPPPPPAATSSSRPKSPYGPASIGSAAAPSLSGLQTPTTSASSHAHGRYPRSSVKMADQFGTTSSSFARSHQR